MLGRGRTFARSLGRTRLFTTSIYVEGIHWRTDSTRLRESFEKFGAVSQACILPTSEDTMFLSGCVTFKHSEDAFRAMLAMNGQELDGRLVKVDYFDGDLDDME
ncbi:hypothetical protein SDRG_07538 [Saprolegnia diclina VS20]|uniref:RRM domain-containing protein n=2 Tax=Saprolegnia TaxID=4769 RepID=A0A067CJS9_SAPPC|nr:hypothetical protein SDRG_07538 [Saprolegnia diclina VS20]XP_012198443.1 hypothetical protein SPRG_04644 [Saprolegnia parasitica CBS 223.65]EQC34724.1 hypothetical protein SDRG_07538 [Saprolegnia diclina VS20]KDO30743.1 hypothetical protein SPRG_04644 [Saprolegnia parasitica CBS 223.65]|eukprot:XP_008611596.1 hypothetical protein SDRG_07538 [Saprolegnia diclina VS20]